MNAARGPSSPPPFPLGLRLQMLSRLMVVQASWNYESMVGTGLGFVVEPALRGLPGGRNGQAYRDALSRESGYFNAHPYLTGVAAGALARAELDGEPAQKITRFRTALCGPLGSLGDRLVWAGLLPFCSLVALALFGLGVAPIVVVAAFLILYNLGHLYLRAWGLNVGWRYGLGVSTALGGTLMRAGPTYISRAGAVMTGITFPLVIHRLSGGTVLTTALAIVAVVLFTAVLLFFKDRVQGWRGALAVLVIYALLVVAI